MHSVLKITNFNPFKCIETGHFMPHRDYIFSMLKITKCQYFNINFLGISIDQIYFPYKNLVTFGWVKISFTEKKMV